MTRNMGTIDRALRTFVAAPLAMVLAWAVGLTTALGIVLLVVAGIMLATSAVGFCPLYRLIGLSTCPVAKQYAEQRR